MIVKKLKNENYRDELRKIWFESPFIGSYEEICHKIDKKYDPVAIPFGAYKDNEIAGFLTIELSNPGVDFKTTGKSVWIGSFHVARKLQKKGYAKEILKLLPCTVRSFLPDIGAINLTVNVKNRAAKNLYLSSGYFDTGIIYEGGPAGPQYILTLSLSEEINERD